MKYNTKVDIVYHAIRCGIERGEYLPGDRIVISRIAKANGCSEIPVREALRRLESEKVVELIPNKGAVVSSISKSYLEQLFQVKIVLESYAARLSVDFLTKTQLKHLRKMAEQMSEAFENGNLKKSSALNYKFHMTIYRSAGNDVLSGYIDEMWNKWPIGRYTDYVPDEWYRISLKQHFDLLEAIEAKDYDKVEELIRSHKSGALRNLGRREERIPLIE